MLDPFSHYNAVFVEITRSHHQHGGKGWEFGKFLWSPSTNRAGNDRYALMRAPLARDLVLHFYEDSWPDGKTDMRLCGFSRVNAPYTSIDDEPPLRGDWSGMQPYYRIELRDYNSFPHPLPVRTLTSEYEDSIRSDP